jgi:hypothetical protein
MVSRAKSETSALKTVFMVQKIQSFSLVILYCVHGVFGDAAILVDIEGWCLLSISRS